MNLNLSMSDAVPFVYLAQENGTLAQREPHSRVKRTALLSPSERFSRTKSAVLFVRECRSDSKIRKSSEKKMQICP